MSTTCGIDLGTSSSAIATVIFGQGIVQLADGKGIA
jgi:hypothetical protein